LRFSKRDEKQGVAIEPEAVFMPWSMKISEIRDEEKKGH